MIEIVDLTSRPAEEEDKMVEILLILRITVNLNVLHLPVKRQKFSALKIQLL